MAVEKIQNADGSVRWRARVKDPNGRWYPAESRTSQKQARIDEGKLLEQKQKGSGTLSEDARQTSMRDYWSVWSVDRRADTSEGWKISQNQMYRDYIDVKIGKESIGEKKIAAFDAPTIGRILNRVKELGRSDQMRLLVYSLLRQLFADAVEYYQMLDKSPVSAKLHRPKKIVSKKQEFLQPGQAEQFLTSVMDHYAGPAVWLETLSGLRTEAMQALLWKAVDWDRSQILICRAYKAKVKRIEEYPKGRSHEYVPMVPALKAYLWALWEKSAKDLDDFVCQGPRGGMLSRDTYSHAMPELCRRAGVPRVSPHQLRHSCSELFVQQGATQEDLRRLFNHKDAKTTQRYIHRTDGRLNEIARNVAQPMLRVIEGGKFPAGVPAGTEKPYVPLSGNVLSS